jgi:hypothetical protein
LPIQRALVPPHSLQVKIVLSLAMAMDCDGRPWHFQGICLQLIRIKYWTNISLGNILAAVLEMGVHLKPLKASRHRPAPCID